MSGFCIEATNLTWLTDKTADTGDHCLHGHARAVVAGRVIEYDCTVSSTALYLLKTLTEDHVPTLGGQQMLPCCGFFLAADAAGENVSIIGCDNGEDWTVWHEGENVRLILPDGTDEVVPLAEYAQEVYRFADEIEAYYNACPPRDELTDAFDQKGYETFWKEWHRRRNA